METACQCRTHVLALSRFLPPQEPQLSLGWGLDLSVEEVSESMLHFSRETQTQAPGTLCGCELSSMEPSCGWQPRESAFFSILCEDPLWSTLGVLPLMG